MHEPVTFASLFASLGNYVLDRGFPEGKLSAVLCTEFLQNSYRILWLSPIMESSA